MRVLLAGATGAIGRRLVPQLLDAGHQVTGITRHSGELADSGATELVADLLDRSAVLEAVDGMRFDAVMNQASNLARAPLTYGNMIPTNRLRSEATSTLIAAARATGARRFVTASIFYGYGFSDHGPEPLTEEEPFGLLSTANLDPIHSALLSNEQQVRAFGGVALRYGLFYGDGPSPVAASDFDGELPFIHLEDAASAAVRAMEKGKPGEAYNIADDRPVSWRELQQAAAIAAGRRFPVAVPSWLLRTSAPFGAELLTRTSMRLSTAKAKKQLGWEPRYPSFAEGLASEVVLASADEEQVVSST